jgi:hypothetical protein
MHWAPCRPRSAPIGRDRASAARAVSRFLSALVALGALAGRSAQALVVNIDATTNNLANPVDVVLAAGTYSVTPIGTADGGVYDAWNPWGATTCSVPSGCAQTDPTTAIGWKNAYDVISAAISAVSVTGSPLAPVASEPTGFARIHDHWIASPSVDRYHLDDAAVYPTAADALATAESSVFTVSASGLVGFSIRDDPTIDNLGGMSLLISEIPEPATAPLLILGVAALALRRRGSSHR